MTGAVQTRYRVAGMDCGSCAAKVDAAVRRLPGVEDLSVSVTAGTMTVRHRPDKPLFTAIKAQLSGLGYDLTRADEAPHNQSAAYAHHDDDTASLHSHGHEHGASNGPWWGSRKGLLTLACGLALVVAFVVGQLGPATEHWGFLVAMAIGLVPIARRALMAARTGTPFSIEKLMTIAAVGAVIIGAAEEAATVVFLFLIGELLEGVAAGRARASIQSLSALVPKTALVERDGRTGEVPADQLAVGSVIVV